MFFWSLGGNAAQTLLDFGARRAAVKQYEAAYNASVASYRETVLNAFKEVEDNLVATRTLADQTARQQLAVTASQRYQQLASIRYRDGLDNYLNVLTAQNAVFEQPRSDGRAADRPHDDGGSAHRGSGRRLGRVGFCRIRRPRRRSGGSGGDSGAVGVGSKDGELSRMISIQPASRRNGS